MQQKLVDIIYMDYHDPPDIIAIPVLANVPCKDLGNGVNWKPLHELPLQ